MAISLASIQTELLPGLVALARERADDKSELREVLFAQQLTRRAIADNLYLAEFKLMPAPPVIDPTTIDLSAPVIDASLCWPPKVDLLID